MDTKGAIQYLKQQNAHTNNKYVIQNVPCPRKVVFSSMQLLKNQHHHTNPSNPNPTMT